MGILKTPAASMKGSSLNEHCPQILFSKITADNLCQTKMLATQVGLPCTSQHMLRHMNSNWNRARLPVNQHYQDILECVAENDVTIIVGSTGCGKTTRVPQFILYQQLLPRVENTLASASFDHLNALVQHDHKIIITQPRRIATINAAERIRREIGAVDTDMVAHEIGQDKQATPQTRIVVCTTGVLVQRIVNQGGEALDQYNYIIVDEVHEREQDMDLVLLLVRERLRDLLYKVEKQCRNSLSECADVTEKAAFIRRHMQLIAPKIILMSATIDVARLKAYFSETVTGGLSIGTVNIVQRLRVVDEYFLGDWAGLLVTSGGGGDTLTQQLLAEKATAGSLSSAAAGANAAETLLMRRPVFNASMVEHLCTLISMLDTVEVQKFGRVPSPIANADARNGDDEDADATTVGPASTISGILSTGRGTVLVFLPGYEEISRVRVALERIARIHNLEVMFMHSSVSADDQRRAVSESAMDGTGMRRVILCTNICESSLTVPGVRFVFDFCMQKVMEWDSDTLMSSLNLRYASKAACSQRKGRTGRDCDGCVYRLITREAFEQLTSENEADMRIGPLHNTILRLKTFIDRESCALYGSPASSLSVFSLLSECLDSPTRPVYDLQLQQLREIGALTNPYRITSPAAASGFKAITDTDTNSIDVRRESSNSTPLKSPDMPKRGAQVSPASANVSPPQTKNSLRGQGDLLVIDDGDSEGLLTPLGEFISGFPIELEAAKCLLYSCMFGCLDDGIVAAAALTTPSVFEIGFNKDRPIETVAKKSIWIGLQDDRSDLLATCNAYKCWRSYTDDGNRRAFADFHGLRHGRLENMERMRKDLQTMYEEKGLLNSSWSPWRNDNGFSDDDDDYADDDALSPSKHSDEVEKQFLLSIAVAAALYPSYYMLMPLNDEQRMRFAEFGAAGISGSDVYRTFCVRIRIPSAGVVPNVRHIDAERIERALKSHLANGLLDGINFSVTHLPLFAETTGQPESGQKSSMTDESSRFDMPTTSAAGTQTTTWFITLGAREATLASVKDRIHPYMYRIMSGETTQKFNLTIDIDENYGRGRADRDANNSAVVNANGNTDMPDGVVGSPVIVSPPLQRKPLEKPSHITDFEWRALLKSIRSYKINAYEVTDIEDRRAILKKQFGQYAGIMEPMLLLPESEQDYQVSTSSNSSTKSSSSSTVSSRRSEQVAGESRPTETRAPATQKDNTAPASSKTKKNAATELPPLLHTSQTRHYTKVFVTDSNTFIPEDFWTNNAAQETNMLTIPVGQQNTSAYNYALHDCFVMHFATSAEFCVLPARFVPVHQLMRSAIDRVVLKLQCTQKAEQQQQLLPFEVDEAVVARNPAFREPKLKSTLPNLAHAGEEEDYESRFVYRSQWARGIFLGYDIELQQQQLQQTTGWSGKRTADTAAGGDEVNADSKPSATGAAGFVFFVDSGNYARVSIVKGHIYHMPAKNDVELLTDNDAVLYSKPLAQKCVFAQQSQAVLLHEHMVVDRVEQYLMQYPGLFRVSLDDSAANERAKNKLRGLPTVWSVRKLFAVVNVRQNGNAVDNDADADEMMIDLTSSLERLFGWNTSVPADVPAKKPPLSKTTSTVKTDASSVRWPVTSSTANLVQNLLDASAAATEAAKNPNSVDLECQIEPHPLMCTSVRSIREDFAAAGVVMQSTSLNNVQFHQQQQALLQVLVGFQAQKPRKNNNIMLRETHMLPPVPGLLGLLGLCLAPDVQLVSFGATGKFDSNDIPGADRKNIASLPRRWPTVHDVVGLIGSLNVTPANVLRMLTAPLPAGSNSAGNSDVPSKSSRTNDEVSNAVSSSNSSELAEDDSDVLWNDSAAGIEAMLRKKLLYLPLDVHLCREDLTDANEIRKTMSEIALYLGDRQFVTGGRLTRLQQHLRRSVLTLFGRSRQMQANFMPYADLRKEAVSLATRKATSPPPMLLHFNLPSVLSEYYEQDKLDGPELKNWIWRKPVCMPEQCDWRDAVDASLQRKVESVVAFEQNAKIGGCGTRSPKRASACDAHNDDDYRLTYFHYCSLCAQAVGGEEGVAKHVASKGHAEESRKLVEYFTY